MRPPPSSPGNHPLTRRTARASAPATAASSTTFVALSTDLRSYPQVQVFPTVTYGALQIPEAVVDPMVVGEGLGPGCSRGLGRPRSPTRRRTGLRWSGAGSPRARRRTARGPTRGGRPASPSGRRSRSCTASPRRLSADASRTRTPEVEGAGEGPAPADLLDRGVACRAVRFPEHRPMMPSAGFHRARSAPSSCRALT